MAYDIKLREKVITYLSKGHTVREAQEVFEIGSTTIKRWKKQLRETGTLEKRPLNRKPTKLCPVRLRAYINENPDSYLHEIAKAFNCTQPAVFYALKRMGITRKKNG